MATGPLMIIYKPNIISFTKYHHLKATLFLHPLYVKLTPLLGNKFAQVFTSGDFILVVPMKSKAYGGIGLMDLFGKHGIPEEPRYDNAKE